MDKTTLVYEAIPTIADFHSYDTAQRCIVGPVGSGKTSGATIEMIMNISRHMANTYGVTETRGVILRNTYLELRDTTLKTVNDWFPWGEWTAGERRLDVYFPKSEGCNFDLHVEVLFRSCDRPEDMKKFKSLEITWFWADEANEINEDIKRMLRNRIGRFPRKCPARFGVETSNPFSIDHPMYWQYNWVPPGVDVSKYPVNPKTLEYVPIPGKVDAYGRFIPWPVPGPYPKRKPLGGFLGWWQPPHENDANLRAGYYDDLRREYGVNPDWVSMYIDGKPGVRVEGKLVYANFNASRHCPVDPITWNGSPLYFGWDNSGNFPAAVVLQLAGPLQVEVLHEWYSEKEGIVDFTRRVLMDTAAMYEGCTVAAHYGDPAGGNRYSKAAGGLTSNSQLQYDECGIIIIPSEQNPDARIQAVDQMLARSDAIKINNSCTRLIEGFIGGYVFPERLGFQGEYMLHPVKNKYSHPHDALQYVMVRLFSPRKRQEEERQIRQQTAWNKQFESDVDSSSDVDYDMLRR